MPRGPARLEWSSTPDRLVPSLVGRQPVAFDVRRRGGVRTRRPVRLALVPLSEVRDGRVLGDAVNEWLVWQSVTGVGVIARLPSDVDHLASEMGLGRRGYAALARTALRALFDALYEERRL